MKKENIISEESAADQLNEFFEFYDLEREDFEDEAFERIFNRLTRAICRGRLEIKENLDGDLEVIQKIKKGAESLTYQVISGKHKIQMKKADANDMNGKIYLLVGALTGVGPDAIKSLKGSDLGLVENLGAIFLNV